VVKRKISRARRPTYCPLCGKYVHRPFYLHAEIHVKKLVERGVVREEVFDFGIERRTVWVYRDRYYLTPTRVFQAVLADMGGGDGHHTWVRVDR